MADTLHAQVEIDTLVSRFPELESLSVDLYSAFCCIRDAYQSGNKLLLCGNGGSAADADHIVGELMKAFLLKRPLDGACQKNLMSVCDADQAADLFSHLQGGLPAISLAAQTALCTAVGNDIGYAFVFAQQVMALGKKGDVFLGLSTSGCAANVVNAAITAKAIGMSVIGMTGRTGGSLRRFCDICLCAPADATYLIQELHLPIYHALCAMIEREFFGEKA